MTQAKERHFGRNIVSGAGILVLAAILILVNVLFSRASIRWDATEENAYSLSAGTLEVLSNLKDPVTVKLFYSASQAKLPIYVKNHAKRVQELLQEYQIESGGMLTFETCDPLPDSDEEEWADIYNMEAKALQTGERVYFGLIAYCQDREETIPFLDYSREELLEYDLTRMLTKITTDEKMTIGVLSTLPVMGQTQIPGAPRMPGADQSWHFITELKQNYEVKEVVATTASIPGDVDVLVVLHPKMLRPETQYAVDRFIGEGKNAIILVDPISTVDQNASRGRGINASSLDTLFKAWGLEMDSHLAAVDLNQQTKVRNRFNVVEEDPSWITVREDYINRDDPITSNLEELLLPMPGAFSLNEDSPLAFEPLITTSEDSALIQSFEATLGARSIKQGFVPGKEKLALAARLRGVFPSAFPNGPPEEARDLIQEDAEGAAERKEASVIVIADVDLIYDDVCIMHMQTPFGFAMAVPRNDNMTLFVNACEMLTGSRSLISIRSRGKTERPFTKVLELKNKAQNKWLAKEKELMARAEEARKNLAELEERKDAQQRFIMSPEQQDAIDNFKEQQREIEAELKEVRKNLRSDIVSLGWLLKFINVLLAPILVTLAGLAFGIYRHKRMKSA